MEYGVGTVFVFGAGFTKAFLPTAPLLVDDFDGEKLKESFKSFDYASSILQAELDNPDHDGGKLNLERLMTRLSSRMPYDFEKNAIAELDLLLSELKKALKCRLVKAREGVKALPAELWTLVAHICHHQTHCITFNYDDLLDDTLYRFGFGWSPDSGYGLSSKTSTILNDYHPNLPPTSLNVKLYKLHGSLNWRIPIGTPKPYPLNSIRHHEHWYGRPYNPQVTLEDVEHFLEPEPFMVPPILTKAELVEQPILRVIWSSALEALKASRSVVFVGYSLPITDIAATFLFREGLAHLPSDKVRIVDFASSSNRKPKCEELLKSYGRVFAQLNESQIELEGAADWISRTITKWLYDSKGKPIAFCAGNIGDGQAFNTEGKYLGTTGAWSQQNDKKYELWRAGYRGEIISGKRLLFREGHSNEIKGATNGRFEPTAPILPEIIEPCALPTGLRDLMPEELMPTT